MAVLRGVRHAVTGGTHPLEQGASLSAD
jgi:hypothetical protein